MPTASLIKLPVMIEAYRQADAGKVKLDQRIEVSKEGHGPGIRNIDKSLLSRHFDFLARCYPVDDCLFGQYGDKPSRRCDWFASDIGCDEVLGYPETQLHSKVFRRDVSISPERSEKYGLGSTTSLDMVNLLVRLKRGELASPGSTEAMLDHLSHCDDKTRFPLLLPDTVKVAHKTGSVTRVRTDAGLLIGSGCTISLCVLTDNNKDIRWSDDNAGNMVCAKIARSVYDALAPKAIKQETAPSQVKTMKRERPAKWSKLCKER